MAKKEEEVKGIFKHLKNTNVKIGIVIAFLISYQELMPLLKDTLGFNDDLEAVVDESKEYTDEQVAINKEEADQWLDYFLYEITEINKRYTVDSLAHASKSHKFAVGLRSDSNGIVSYRNRHGKECSVRINHITDEIEFYNEQKQRWDRIFFEDL